MYAKPNKFQFCWNHKHIMIFGTFKVKSKKLLNQIKTQLYGCSCSFQKIQGTLFGLFYSIYSDYFDISIYSIYFFETFHHLNCCLICENFNFETNLN